MIGDVSGKNPWRSPAGDVMTTGNELGRYRVLIADPDDAARERLAANLRGTGSFTTDEATTGEVVRQLVDEKPYDALLLEMDLPDMDGRELCRMLREKRFAPPIVIMSRSPADADLMLSFDFGANDYIVKPFRSGVLMARLRAHLRNFARTEDISFHIGKCLFNVAHQKLRCPVSGKEIHLTNSEAKILKYLLLRSYAAIDYGTIMREALGTRSHATIQGLHTFIYRLRHKIEADPKNPTIILSTRGGYMLCPNAAIERVPLSKPV